MSDPKTQISLAQMIVFELDQEEYAVPILDVTEVIRKSEITPVPQGPGFISGIINLRGKVVPVLDLEKRFSLIHESDTTPTHIIIAETEKENAYVGVLVDQVSQVLKIPEDMIKPVPTAVTSKIAKDFLKGVIVLEEENKKEGTERILLILDLRRVLSMEDIEKIIEKENSHFQMPISN